MAQLNLSNIQLTYALKKRQYFYADPFFFSPKKNRNLAKKSSEKRRSPRF